WKQGHRRAPDPRQGARWTLQPVVLALLALTWCAGDSVGERFETAKAVCAACLPKKRRPGKTRAGFEKALAKLPCAALEALAGAGFNGYFQAQAVLRAGGSFLIRMSSKVRLRTDRPVSAAGWRDGQVYYWTQEADTAGQLPLKVRLIRLRPRGKKHEVWLLTD